MKNSFIPFDRTFYARETSTVARELLGAFLLKHEGDELVGGRIVETEAYLPVHDRASHGAIGKTKRNASMFLDAGHAYVYRMRQYCLFNVVTETTDRAGAVLIRAVEPCIGIERMQERTGVREITRLANGPGKLCRALGITHSNDGMLLTRSTSMIFLAPDTAQTRAPIIISSTRIGISRSSDLLLRFTLEKNPFVSKPVRS